ncbi:MULTISPECIES: diguanylate cyclase [unclassified Polynucleobacter]|uniref:sensor domain-containing diguanylate cyclase n=1 Tax=unclassified Polynucleobacter TaxID=2640945 RepID=UPI002490200C|nr:MULTISPECIES: diguanylate cyclase [unclassified Polynucleobacter]
MLSKNVEQIIKKNETQLNNLTDLINNLSLKNASEFKRFASEKKQFERLVDTLKSDPIIDVVTLVDEDGFVLNFSRKYPPPPINLSDRDYFIYLRSHTDSNTFFSAPVKNKGTGDWVFYLARRINGPNQEFLGVVLIGISVQIFSDLFAQIGEKLGHGSSVILYNQDKILISRWPLKEENIGKLNPNQIIDQSLKNPDRSNNTIIVNDFGFNRGTDPIERMVNFQQVPDVPFIVGASIVKEAYLSEWFKSVHLIFLSTIFFLIFIVILYLVLEKSYRNNVSIQFRADHDPLTGLLNRSLFQDRLHQAISKSKRQNHLFALLFVDVDQFKNINDHFGHHIGDLTLIEIAARLKSSVREDDSIGRLGGDEFLILLENIDHPSNALQVAEKIRLKLHQLMQLNEISININVSIGISIYPLDGIDADILIDKSDQAMYNVKQTGSNACQLFS